MTINESEKYRAAIIRSAPEWARGENTIGSQEELCIIADYYGVTLPRYMEHFRYSNSPNHVSATGAHKGILRTLGKLRVAIENATDDFSDIDTATVRAALESGEPSAFVARVMRDVSRLEASA